MTLDRNFEGEVDVGKPPAGAWHSETPGAMVVGARIRSVIAAVILSVIVVMGGFVLLSVCVQELLCAIHGNLLDPPSLLAPVLLAGEHCRGDETISSAVFTALFGVLFCGVPTIAVALSLFGIVEVRIRGDSGEVFTGIGSFGYRRRFRVSALRDVRIEVVTVKDWDTVYIVLDLIDQRRIRFGSTLEEEPRRFIATVLGRSCATGSASLPSKETVA